MSNKLSLKEEISKDYMMAFKARKDLDKKLLSVVKGEIQTLEKNMRVETLSDKEVTKILNKMSKSLKESLSNGDEVAKEELEIISKYLPKEMSEIEIKEKVSQFIKDGVDNIGGIMKKFSKLPADKKLVSKYFREIYNQ
jgi:uncharacterized protein YqeY